MNARIVPMRILIVGLLALGFAVFAGRAQAQSGLAAMMQQTGLKYSPVANQTDSWEVPYDLPGGQVMKEYITYSNDTHEFAMIFTTVIDRPPHYVYSYALLTKAMELNNDRPGAKFVLDDDNGDIDCQTEVYMPTATPALLKMALDNVASTANVYGKELNGL